MSQIRVGRVTASDRASSGTYEDLSGPEIEVHVGKLFADAELLWNRKVVSDEREQIEAALKYLVDREKCSLVITTGGTGPGRRDVTPEALRAVIEKELPGFGEIMRVRSFDRVPTSILSRATAGVRGSTLLVNLPGRPAAVAECLGLVGEAMRHALEILSGEDADLTHARMDG